MLAQFSGWSPSQDDRLLGVFLFLPVIRPSGFTSLRLYREQFEGAVTLAISMGGALFAAEGCLLYFAIPWDHRRWLFCALIAGSCASLILMIFGWKLAKFLTQPPRFATFRTLRHVGYAIAILWIFWVAYSPVPHHILENERDALRYVAHRAFSVSENARIEHAGLLAEEHGSLGAGLRTECHSDPPPPNVAADYGLPRGHKFEYRGRQAATTVNGCTWFQGSTTTARPSAYRETGIKSYFVDETLRIHFTSENRAAQVRDPDTSALEVMLESHRPS
jgi:hypothetical protein